MSIKSKTGVRPVETLDGMEDQLRDLAREIVSNLSGLDEEQSKDLLGAFVSELFLAVAKQKCQAVHRQRQAEGIVAAKARGVRFGPSRKPLPENFEECHQSWREGRMKMKEAAAACGMAKSSFYEAAIRKEQSA